MLKKLKNGAVAELTVVSQKMRCASEDYCADRFEDWDEFGGNIEQDNKICDELRKEGFNAICFDNEDGSKDYLLINFELISDVNVFNTLTKMDEACNELIRLALSK